MAVPFVYPSPTPILPTLNGFSVHKKPIWAALPEESVSGREVTYATAAFPLWEFELTYEVLRSETQNIFPDPYYAPNLEFEAIATVFLACRGQYGRFFYDDLTDDSRAGQFLGTGNDVQTVFPMVRTIGFGATTITETVGGVNIGAGVRVYLNGISVPSLGNWSIGSDLQTLVFNIPPNVGVTVTSDFYFYYLCRFLEDMTDFEQFYHNLWLVKALKFRSVKD